MANAHRGCRVAFSGIGYHAGPRAFFERIAMDEESFNIALRKFLKIVGITSQREIERVVCEGKVEGKQLKLRMTLTAEKGAAQPYRRGDNRPQLRVHGVRRPLIRLARPAPFVYAAAIAASNVWAAICPL